MTTPKDDELEPQSLIYADDIPPGYQPQAAFDDNYEVFEEKAETVQWEPLEDGQEVPELLKGLTKSTDDQDLEEPELPEMEEPTIIRKARRDAKRKAQRANGQEPVTQGKRNKGRFQRKGKVKGPGGLVQGTDAESMKLKKAQLDAAHQVKDRYEADRIGPWRDLGPEGFKARFTNKKGEVFVAWVSPEGITQIIRKQEQSRGAGMPKNGKRQAQKAQGAKANRLRAWKRKWAQLSPDQQEMVRKKLLATRKAKGLEAASDEDTTASNKPVRQGRRGQRRKMAQEMRQQTGLGDQGAQTGNMNDLHVGSNVQMPARGMYQATTPAQNRN